LNKKKYDVSMSLMQSSKAYTSKVTDKKYDSYMDYLDSEGEGATRKGAIGQQSILASDGFNDNGTMFNSSQLAFDSIQIDGVEKESTFTPQTTPQTVDEESKDVTVHKPSENPNEKNTSSHITREAKAPTTMEDMDLDLELDETDIEIKQESYGQTVDNYINILQDYEIFAIFTALRETDGVEVNNMPDAMEYLVKLLEARGQEINDDNLIRIVDEYIQCF